MTRIDPAGVFEAKVPAGTESYRLEADYGQPGQTSTFVFDDPYRAWPTVGELDLHLFGEGRHRRLWDVLGAHPRVHRGHRRDGVRGLGAQCQSGAGSRRLELLGRPGASDALARVAPGCGSFSCPACCPAPATSTS